MEWLKNIAINLAIGSGLLTAYHYLVINPKTTSYDAAMAQLKEAGVISQGEEPDLSKVKKEYLEKIKSKLSMAKSKIQAVAAKPETPEGVKAYKEDSMLGK
jgi:uncharacterized protein YnzC (UPF0291/DUF896 family)